MKDSPLRMSAALLKGQTMMKLCIKKKGIMVTMALMSGLLASGSLMASDGGIGFIDTGDGNLHFEGEITEVACTVDTGSNSQTVSMGTVSTSALHTAGVTAAPKEFSIKLVSCPSTATTASVKFDGPPDSNNSELLGLSAGSTASGVGVAIYEKDGSKLVPLHTMSEGQPIDGEQLNNTLYFVAKYMATVADVQPGTSDATTDFTILYN
jgi:P pilus assembly protein, pilin FimA